MKRILTIILVLLVSVGASSQTKISFADPANLVSATADALLTAKFQSVNLQYTSLVDVNNPCDYYYASLEQEADAYLLSVWDCKRNILGEKSLGKSLFAMSESDQVGMLFYTTMDIINNPGTLKAASPTEPKVEPKAVAPAEPVYSTEDILVNQHSSRYFFSPTSYNLKQGELYYNTIYFALHDLQYGITDNFSFGMGTSIAAFPFYITPKYSFRINDKHALAVGDLMMLGTYGVDFVCNLFYGTYTYGNQFNNITIGLGHLGSKANDLFAKKVSSPVLNISAMAHLSPYMYFVTENYLTTFSREFEADQYALDTLYNGWYPTGYAEKFSQKSVFFVGFTGFRFISKKFDVRSFSVGLGYFNQTLPGIPDKYPEPVWEVDYPFLERIFIPTISYTYKFGKLF